MPLQMSVQVSAPQDSLHANVSLQSPRGHSDGQWIWRSCQNRRSTRRFENRACAQGRLLITVLMVSLAANFSDFLLASFAMW